MAQDVTALLTGVFLKAAIHVKTEVEDYFREDGPQVLYILTIARPVAKRGRISEISSRHVLSPLEERQIIWSRRRATFALLIRP